MKKATVEINGKKHGPLEVFGTLWKYVVFEDMNVGLREIGNMGAIVKKVKEPKEPLVWEGEVMCGEGSVWPSGFSDFPSEFKNKRFRARLEEIVE